ncbi:hypothetical protein VKT23_019427 [Stygiomarasmius scandens]|uniref:Uncharacterized protein n=1 Tax=Marasmiellus scandens TaxID=2682957 RepID=A0ABR1ILH4_9AGAR
MSLVEVSDASTPLPEPEPEPYLVGLVLNPEQLYIFAKGILSAKVLDEQYGGDAMSALDSYWEEKKVEKCIVPLNMKYYMVIIDILPSEEGKRPHPIINKLALKTLYQDLGCPSEWKQVHITVEKWPSSPYLPGGWWFSMILAAVDHSPAEPPWVRRRMAFMTRDPHQKNQFFLPKNTERRRDALVL